MNSQVTKKSSATGDHSTMAGDYGRTLAGDYDLFGDANKMATEGSALPSVNTNT